MPRGGTPKVTDLFPIVATVDLERALGFYRDQLGGVVMFSYPGPHGEPVYVGVDIKSSHLGIGLDPALRAGPLPRAVSLWVYTDDCDSLVEGLRAAGRKDHSGASRPAVGRTRRACTRSRRQRGDHRPAARILRV